MEAESGIVASAAAAVQSGVDMVELAPAVNSASPTATPVQMAIVHGASAVHMDSIDSSPAVEVARLAQSDGSGVQIFSAKSVFVDELSGHQLPWERRRQAIPWCCRAPDGHDRMHKR